MFLCLWLLTFGSLFTFELYTVRARGFELFKLSFDDFCFLTLTMIVGGSTEGCGVTTPCCSANTKLALVIHQLFHQEYYSVKQLMYHKCLHYKVFSTVHAIDFSFIRHVNDLQSDICFMSGSTAYVCLLIAFLTTVIYGGDCQMLHWVYV